VSRSPNPSSRTSRRLAPRRFSSASGSSSIRRTKAGVEAQRDEHDGRGGHRSGAADDRFRAGDAGEVPVERRVGQRQHERLRGPGLLLPRQADADGVQVAAPERLVGAGVAAVGPGLALRHRLEAEIGQRPEGARPSVRAARRDVSVDQAVGAAVRAGARRLREVAPLDESVEAFRRGPRLLAEEDRGVQDRPEVRRAAEPAGLEDLHPRSDHPPHEGVGEEGEGGLVVARLQVVAHHPVLGAREEGGLPVGVGRAHRVDRPGRGREDEMIPDLRHVTRHAAVLGDPLAEEDLPEDRRRRAAPDQQRRRRALADERVGEDSRDRLPDARVERRRLGRIRQAEASEQRAQIHRDAAVAAVERLHVVGPEAELPAELHERLPVREPDEQPVARGEGGLGVARSFRPAPRAPWRGPAAA
jgi:hypothetical protein